MIVLIYCNTATTREGGTMNGADAILVICDTVWDKLRPQDPGGSNIAAVGG